MATADDVIKQIQTLGEMVLVPLVEGDTAKAKANLKAIYAYAGRPWPYVAPVPLPPPSPSAVLGQIIADMSGTHAGTVCGAAGYDWERGPVRQQVLPEGKPRATIWAMNNYDCANPIGTGSVEIRNPQLWAHGPTGWVLIVSSVYGSQINDANYGPAIYGGAGSGPAFGIPADKGVQWFGPQHNIPQGCDGILATYEARLATSGATSLMVNAGADWWGDSGNRGACVGKFKRVTGIWQRFSAYTLTDAAMREADSPV